MADGVFEQFYAEVLLETPGCTKPVAFHHLKRAAREFIKQTNAWKLQLPDIDIDNYEFEINNNTSGIIKRIDKLEVSYDAGSSWNEVHKSGWYYSPETSVISVPYYENTELSDIKMRVTVVLVPPHNMGNDDPFPSWIIDKYPDALPFGAKSTLMIIPKTKFFNANLANYYAREFARIIKEAKVELARGSKNYCQGMQA